MAAIPQAPSSEFFSKHEARVTALEVTFEGIKEDIHETRIVLGTITDRLDTIGRPNWQVILPALGLFLTLITAFGAATLTPLYIKAQNNTDNIRRLDAYAVSDERIAARAMAELRDEIQLEARLRIICGEPCSQIGIHGY